jgi:Putative zinc-binding metallo-peptidase
MLMPVVSGVSWASDTGVSITTNSIQAPNGEARIKMLETLVHSAAFSFSYHTLSVLIDTALVEPRGRMKWPSITLSSQVAKDGEFLCLFAHELAHYIDIYVYTPDEWVDPSSRFYEISWQAPTIKRATQGSSAFITGYAATNQYEDFAESFTFYVFHNRAFQDRALKNDALRQKYLFLQAVIFPKGYFIDSDFTIGKIPAYVWDSTKIPISLQKYLYFLGESI